MVKITKKKILTGVTGGVILGGIGYGVYSMTKRKTSTNDSTSSSDTSSSSTGTESGTGTGTGSSSSSSSSKSSSSSDTKGYTKKTVVKDVPITNYKDAKEFAELEWSKIKRDNGRALECQVLGSTRWKVGEWCYVYLPSFDIDGYMYIIRVSQSSDGGDWTCNLSLVDYPPGWGEEELEEEAEQKNNENTEEENTDTNTTS